LRYSTDDGITFPFANLIFSTTDSDLTSFEWTVPGVQTSQARIRLIAATRAGAAVEIRSGRFSIDGAGGSALPQISGVSFKGKKLFLDGANFQMGAKVFLNGVSQKTNNEGDFSHRLRCKKSGDKIIPGVPASLKVVNPDGTESPTFEYTRPEG
ncbi:MAG TPA: hypothetical protein VKC34_07430, partial [Blastocatellia bacterium]|nr:hypothetical protein [Blastocatellia bacterium]